MAREQPENNWPIAENFSKQKHFRRFICPSRASALELFNRCLIRNYRLELITRYGDYKQAKQGTLNADENGVKSESLLKYQFL